MDRCGRRLAPTFDGSVQANWQRRRGLPAHPVRTARRPALAQVRLCPTYTEMQGGQGPKVLTCDEPQSISNLSGSPPRAWGQRSSGNRSAWQWPVRPHVRGDNAARWPLGMAVQRFTPTCVGTTLLDGRLAWPFSGSPPRAWGQRHTCGSICRFFPVHPHVRGDNG
jgi:hypothetical protein